MDTKETSFGSSEREDSGKVFVYNRYASQPISVQRAMLPIQMNSVSL